jgi:hypothetical protein
MRKPLQIKITIHPVNHPKAILIVKNFTNEDNPTKLHCAYARNKTEWWNKNIERLSGEPWVMSIGDTKIIKLGHPLVYEFRAMLEMVSKTNIFEITMYFNKLLPWFVSQDGSPRKEKL